MFKILVLNFSSYSFTDTRIIYDRKFLLECKNSPIARTPPYCLPQIPGVTIPPVPPSRLELLKEQKQTEEETTGKKVGLAIKCLCKVELGLNSKRGSCANWAYKHLNE